MHKSHNVQSHESDVLSYSECKLVKLFWGFAPGSPLGRAYSAPSLKLPSCTTVFLLATLKKWIRHWLYFLKSSKGNGYWWNPWQYYIVQHSHINIVKKDVKITQRKHKIIHFNNTELSLNCLIQFFVESQKILWWSSLCLNLSGSTTTYVKQNS